MKDLNTYLTSVESASKFPCELGLVGGFINFRNSGARGSVKEFTVSLPSILNGLRDIKDNIGAFSNLTSYVEKEWRDAGSKYFSDLALNSIITVQTKPCFTTLSKIINWANNKNATEFKDNEIDLNVSALDQAIFYVEKLIVKYTPIPTKLVDAVENKFITTKIRDFAFKIIGLLFKDHSSEMTLLMQPNEDSNKFDLPFLPQVIKVSDKELQAADLSTGVAETLRFFTTPLLIENKFIYISTQWYGDNRNGLSFGNLKLFLTEHFPQYIIIKEDNQYKLLIAKSNNTIDCLLSKPFLLLAGISGTGKTRFVRKQAEKSGVLNETYCLTAVRPDWHEPSDLLGYVSRLSGKSEYVVTDVLKFIVKSWLEIEQNGITFIKNSATGSKTQQQQVKAFWLCLDEMNLAPVEQYFADYLSVLETREWFWSDDVFRYQCDPLLKPSIFDDIEQGKLKKELGLEGHDDLWQHFLENGISIPFNLIVAGTVNMDETTHGFSRKVIDRALTFDFGEFFPNDFTEFFDPTHTPEILGYPVLTDGRDKAALSATFDKDGGLSIALLESINLVLTNTPFKLAYRALNELLLSVISHKPKTDIELMAVWDDFLMCKVLPRIEGDIDKLTKVGEDKNILEQLDESLSDQFKNIWDSKVRPDLYRKSLEDDQPIAIECRVKVKLDWMRAQLENGFTSFWP